MLFAMVFEATVLNAATIDIEHKVDIARMETNVFSTAHYLGDIDLLEIYFAKWANYRNLGVPIPEEAPEYSITSTQRVAKTNELFLSIRCSSDVYLTNEPVVVIILLRNIGQNSKILKRFYVDHKSYDFNLRYQETNVITWTNPDKPVKRENLVGGQSIGFQYLELSGRSQLITLVRLEQLVKLKSAGSYSMQIRYHDFPYNGMETTNLLSNCVKFEIVEQLSPSQIAARKAQDDYEKNIEMRIKELRLNRKN
jgi:hypothetical protein